MIAGKGPYLADLRAWLAAADHGEVQLVVSALMPLEVLGGSRDERTTVSADAALLALDRHSVRQVAASRPVVTEARALRLALGLKSMDAIHLASAAIGHADAFLTGDGALLTIGEYRGIVIVPPLWPGDVPFDFEDPAGDPGSE